MVKLVILVEDEFDLTIPILVEDEFDLTIPISEITPANFRSISTISHLVSKLLDPA
jgi:acyl carrier protein